MSESLTSRIVHVTEWQAKARSLAKPKICWVILISPPDVVGESVSAGWVSVGYHIFGYYVFLWIRVYFSF